MRLLLTPMLLLAASGALAQEIYTWRDADGVVHHSDTAPPKGKFETRTIRQTTSAGPAAAEGATDDKAKARAEACALARKNVEVINGNATIRMDLDGDGTAETLTAEQRAAALSQAQAQSDLTCKPERPAPTSRADE